MKSRVAGPIGPWTSRTIAWRSDKPFKDAGDSCPWTSLAHRTMKMTASRYKPAFFINTSPPPACTLTSLFQETLLLLTIRSRAMFPVKIQCFSNAGP
jgi:hypothetical protein